MPKVYEVLFRFNYPHPLGKAHDIFFTERDANRVEEMTPEAIKRYKALGYLRETELTEEQHADFQEITNDVQIPFKPGQMVAPIVGPESLPYPLGTSGKRLLGRMKKAFAGQEGALKLLARHDAAEAASAGGYGGPGASEVGERLQELPDEEDGRAKSRKSGGRS